MSKAQAGAAGDARAERLSRALRDNLKRRKAQARLRSSEGTVGDRAPSRGPLAPGGREP